MKFIELLDHRRILLGLGTALLTTVLVAAAAAGLISAEALELRHMGYCAALALILSAFLGAHTAGDPANAAVVGVGMLLVLLGLNGAFFGAQVEGLTVTALAIFGGCGASILLRFNGMTKHHRRRRRRKNR